MKVLILGLMMVIGVWGQTLVDVQKLEDCDYEEYKTVLDQYQKAQENLFKIQDKIKTRFGENRNSFSALAICGPERTVKIEFPWVLIYDGPSDCVGLMLNQYNGSIYQTTPGDDLVWRQNENTSDCPTGCECGDGWQMCSDDSPGNFILQDEGNIDPTILIY